MRPTRYVANEDRVVDLKQPAAVRGDGGEHLLRRRRAGDQGGPVQRGLLLGDRVARWAAIPSPAPAAVLPPPRQAPTEPSAHRTQRARSTETNQELPGPAPVAAAKASGSHAARCWED
jgi:hypothetical protein